MNRLITFLSFFSIIFAEEKNKLIIDIEQSLMATCCWSGTVYDHGNKEMEIEIAGMIQNGKTKVEILNYFTDKYGERVLSSPVAEGFNFFAWLAPIFISILSFITIVLYIKSPERDIKTRIFKDDLNIKYNDQIEKELKNLD
ncbi:MAG: cytochrome c-type biogenesis protein [Fidelibacterota bacterium]|jgi:cytochrome c-type biogenesis protein CcmH/NrfF|nr:cytochrome c-type biogenesis protein CcmH [Candidatus Neomarinimicrobiota bacterium]|tara:strand:- start:11053 stop:11478 length:426 start_codon:yes stop_codon:yes gene_type:complete